MRRLVSLAAVSSLAAALLVPAAVAAPRELWPGVTYESGIQFTTHGPVAINVLRGPRPGGLTTLEPVLSNDTVVGREKLTTMEVRLRRTATAAGVNGDYFTLATGKPSGVLMRDAQLVAPPNAGRASAGIRSDGVLESMSRALSRSSVESFGGGRLDWPVWPSAFLCSRKRSVPGPLVRSSTARRSPGIGASTIIRWFFVG